MVQALTKFEFIYLSPWSIAGPQKTWKFLGKITKWSLKIFQTWRKEKKSARCLSRFRGGNLSPYWCDILAAIDNGEVLVTGVNDKKYQASSSSSSPTDELKNSKNYMMEEFLLK